MSVVLAFLAGALVAGMIGLAWVVQSDRHHTGEIISWQGRYDVARARCWAAERLLQRASLELDIAHATNLGMHQAAALLRAESDG